MKKEIIVLLLAFTIIGNADEFYYENGKKSRVKRDRDKSIS